MNTSDDMKTLRVGVIGAGYVSKYHVRAIQSLKDISLIGIYDSNFDRALHAAKHSGTTAYRDLDEMASAHPNVIHILTPPASHCSLTVRALEMGCHVLVEKPMATSTEECDRMIAAARKAGRVLSVSHSARMDPVVLEALRLIREGACGDVLAVDFLRSSDYPPYAGGPIPAHYREGGYPFLDIGVHGLSLMETFLGTICDADVRNVETGRDSYLTFDEWHGFVQCEKGTGHMYLSWNVQPIQNELIIHGTRGVIHVDCYLQICTVRKRLPGPKIAQRIIGAAANSASTFAKVSANVVRFATGRLLPSPGIGISVIKFYEALRQGTPPPVPAEEGRRIVAWAERATRRAAAEKQSMLEQAALAPPPARILVTGATGFLGRALVARLLKSGESIRILARRAVPALEGNPRVHVVRGDLGDPEAVERAIQGVELVYHVGAGMRGGTEAFESATVWGTKNVVAACLRHGIKRLVYVSSLSVLDHAGHPRDVPVTESSPVEAHPELRGSYSQTKLIAENVVLDAIRNRNLPAVILRPGQIFGPGSEKTAPSGVIALGGRWIVMGSGSSRLNLVYIEDVVDALVLAATGQNVCGQIFHLVDADTLTQREYIKAVGRRGSSGPRVSYVPKTVLYLAALGVEILGRLLRRQVPLSRYKIQSLAPLAPFDGSAARDQLGWVPRVGTREGLHRTFGERDSANAVAPSVRDAA
jgi:predicted dehydrogenase/nucleoside-diphosphate-sugar epimerase